MLSMVGALAGNVLQRLMAARNMYVNLTVHIGVAESRIQDMTELINTQKELDLEDSQIFKSLEKELKELDALLGRIIQERSNCCTNCMQGCAGMWGGGAAAYESKLEAHNKNLDQLLKLVHIRIDAKSGQIQLEALYGAPGKLICHAGGREFWKRFFQAERCVSVPIFLGTLIEYEEELCRTFQDWQPHVINCLLGQLDPSHDGIIDAAEFNYFLENCGSRVAPDCQAICDFIVGSALEGTLRGSVVTAHCHEITTVAIHDRFVATGDTGGFTKLWVVNPDSVHLLMVAATGFFNFPVKFLKFQNLGDGTVRLFSATNSIVELEAFTGQIVGYVKKAHISQIVCLDCHTDYLLSVAKYPSQHVHVWHRVPLGEKGGEGGWRLHGPLGNRPGGVFMCKVLGDGTHCATLSTAFRHILQIWNYKSLTCIKSTDTQEGIIPDKFKLVSIAVRKFKGYADICCPAKGKQECLIFTEKFKEEDGSLVEPTKWVKRNQKLPLKNEDFPYSHLSSQGQLSCKQGDQIKYAIWDEGKESAASPWVYPSERKDTNGYKVCFKHNIQTLRCMTNGKFGVCTMKAIVGDRKQYGFFLNDMGSIRCETANERVPILVMSTGTWTRHVLPTQYTSIAASWLMSRHNIVPINGEKGELLGLISTCKATAVHIFLKRTDKLVFQQNLLHKYIFPHKSKKPKRRAETSSPTPTQCISGNNQGSSSSAAPAAGAAAEEPKRELILTVSTNVKSKDAYVPVITSMCLHYMMCESEEGGQPVSTPVIFLGWSSGLITRHEFPKRELPQHVHSEQQFETDNKQSSFEEAAAFGKAAFLSLSLGDAPGDGRRVMEHIYGMYHSVTRHCRDMLSHWAGFLAQNRDLHLWDLTGPNESVHSGILSHLLVDFWLEGYFCPDKAFFMVPRHMRYNLENGLEDYTVLFKNEGKSEDEKTNNNEEKAAVPQREEDRKRILEFALSAFGQLADFTGRTFEKEEEQKEREKAEKETIKSIAKAYNALGDSLRSYVPWGDSATWEKVDTIVDMLLTAFVFRAKNPKQFEGEFFTEEGKVTTAQVADVQVVLKVMKRVEKEEIQKEKERKEAAEAAAASGENNNNNGSFAGSMSFLSPSRRNNSNKKDDRDKEEQYVQLFTDTNCWTHPTDQVTVTGGRHKCPNCRTRLTYVELPWQICLDCARKRKPNDICLRCGKRVIRIPGSTTEPRRSKHHEWHLCNGCYNDSKYELQMVILGMAAEGNTILVGAVPFKHEIWKGGVGDIVRLDARDLDVKDRLSGLYTQGYNNLVSTSKENGLFAVSTNTEAVLIFGTDGDRSLPEQLRSTIPTEGNPPETLLFADLCGTFGLLTGHRNSVIFYELIPGNGSISFSRRFCFDNQSEVVSLGFKDRVRDTACVSIFAGSANGSLRFWKLTPETVEVVKSSKKELTPETLKDKKAAPQLGLIIQGHRCDHVSSCFVTGNFCVTACGDGTYNAVPVDLIDLNKPQKSDEEVEVLLEVPAKKKKEKRSLETSAPQQNQQQPQQPQQELEQERQESAAASSAPKQDVKYVGVDLFERPYSLAFREGKYTIRLIDKKKLNVTGDALRILRSAIPPEDPVKRKDGSVIATDNSSVPGQAKIFIERGEIYVVSYDPNQSERSAGPTAPRHSLKPDELQHPGNRDAVSWHFCFCTYPEQDSTTSLSKNENAPFKGKCLLLQSGPSGVDNIPLSLIPQDQVTLSFTFSELVLSRIGEVRERWLRIWPISMYAFPKKLDSTGASPLIQLVVKEKTSGTELRLTASAQETHWFNFVSPLPEGTTKVSYDVKIECEGKNARGELLLNVGKNEGGEAEKAAPALFLFRPLREDQVPPREATPAMKMTAVGQQLLDKDERTEEGGRQESTIAAEEKSSP